LRRPRWDDVLPERYALESTSTLPWRCRVIHCNWAGVNSESGAGRS
jgi:hypothetical protein